MTQKQKLLILLPIPVLALFLVAGVASANHAWSKYHWNLSTADTIENPLPLGDNLSTALWQGSLGGASFDWNNSVLKNAVATGTSNANCDPRLGRVEVCNGLYGNNGWLGIAQIWVYRGKDGHIAQAIVKANDTYFNTAPYNSDPWRNFVMCQEVGHTFGLGHQDENFSNQNLGTCMDYTNDPDGTILGQLNNEHPNLHDYDMMQNIYAHLNSPSSGPGNSGGKGGGKKGELPASARVTLNGPAEWGQEIAKDAQGRTSLYKRTLGGNIDVITHVFWAE